MTESNLDVFQTQSTAEHLQVINLLLDNKSLGIDISHVQEVIRMVEITSLPRLPDFVEGIINLRGKIIYVIDLRKILKLPFKKYDLHTEIIIAKLGNKVIGMVVDTVKAVCFIPKADIETPSESLPMDNFLSGVARIGEELMLIIDAAKVLDFNQKMMLTELKAEDLAGANYDDKNERRAD